MYSDTLWTVSILDILLCECGNAVAIIYDKMKCKACGSILTHIEYQARSADEAQRSIDRCSNCPLDISLFHRTIREPPSHLKRKLNNRKKLPFINSTNSTQVLMVTGISSFNKVIYQEREPLDLHTCKAKDYLNSASRLYRYYHNGPWSGRILSLTSSKIVAPNISVSTYEEVKLSGHNDNMYDIYTYSVKYGVMYVHDKDAISTTIEVHKKKQVHDAIIKLYLMGFSPEKLYPSLDNSILGTLSNLSARAYDASTFDESLYWVSDKPDGERIWMSRIGVVWLFTRRLIEHQVIGWLVDSDISIDIPDYKGPVVDIELMIATPPILIDILMSDNSVPSPHDRNLDYIRLEFRKLCGKYPILSMIHTRQFYTSIAEARDALSTINYPYDGLVAISKSGTDMLKIKSEKSIELQLQSSGKLVSAEGIELFDSDLHNTYAEGSIIEIRFQLQGTDINIISTFHRPDKRKANSISAIAGVIESSHSRLDKNTIRISIWRWSNKLRHTLYSMASRMIKDKRVILDIGTGEGQSIDAFAEIQDVSFILVEPDSSKCKKLMRRLGVRDMDTNPRSIIRYIGPIQKRSRRYHILNCSMEDILSDAVVVDNMKKIIGCTIACFSAQFITTQLAGICSIGSFVGCCYMYDGIPVGSYIIDKSGIKMHRTSESTAKVYWGSDEPYDEPAVTKETIYHGINIINSKQLIGNPEVEGKDNLQCISSHVEVLISR